MSIAQLAIQDAQRIVTNAVDFASPIILTAPDDTVLNTNALQTKHHSGMDSDGFRVSAKQHSVVISEKVLQDANYPYLTVNDEILLKGHTVETTDSSGKSALYLVQDCFPDRTLGIIVLILQQHA
jgi:hypothetical protein